MSLKIFPRISPAAFGSLNRGDTMRKLTNEQYAELVKRLSPKSVTGPDTLRAFLCGGAVCTLGELITLGLEAAGAAAVWTSVALIFLGALLTGLGVYDKFAAFAGAGALVPITGFANAVASPALEFKTEGLVAGLAAKLFVIAGPVLVYGTLSGVLYGLALCLLKV